MQYVQGCKGLCDNAHGAALKRIQTKIVAKLEWLLKQAKASQALLRCTVGAATTWWQVVSWTSSAGLTEVRAAMVLCSWLLHDEAMVLCDATAWRPPSIGLFLRMNRLQRVCFSFDTFDHACSLAFGEPFKSGWHLSQFDYACEIDFAASIARSAQLGMDVALPRITLDIVPHDEVGWDSIWIASADLKPTSSACIEQGLVEMDDGTVPMFDFLASSAPKRPRRNKSSSSAGRSEVVPGLIELLLAEILEEAESSEADSAAQALHFMQTVEMESKAAREAERDSLDDDASGAGSDSDMDQVDADIGVAGAHMEMHIAQLDVSEEDEQAAADAPLGSVSGAEHAGDAVVVPSTLEAAVHAREHAFVFGLDAPLAPAYVSVAVVCAQLGVSLRTDLFVFDLWQEGQPSIGRLKPCFGGTCVQATCKKHNCKFLLSHKPALGLSLLHVQADLIRWLSAGLTLTCYDHENLLRKINEDRYKMKLKVT